MSKVRLVSCVVALPTQLFRSTGIPVCLWFFARDKKAGKQGSVDRRGEALFIDARNLGYMVDRAERAFTDDDIAKIASTYHSWRGTPSAADTYADELGFCASAALAEIKDAGYALTPGRYVGAADATEDGEGADARVERLTAELLDQFEKSAEMSKAVRAALERLA